MFLFLLFYMWKFLNIAWCYIFYDFIFSYQNYFEREWLLWALWNAILNASYNLEWSPKQIRNRLFGFFFFFLFFLWLSVCFIIWRVGGGKETQNKNPTCFIMTSHMKPNVFNHLNQFHLSSVLYNYSSGYKWRTTAKPWSHGLPGVRMETDLVDSVHVQSSTEERKHQCFSLLSLRIRFQSQTTSIWITVLPLFSWVTSSKLYNHSAAQFPYLLNKDNNLQLLIIL